MDLPTQSLFSAVQTAFLNYLKSINLQGNRPMSVNLLMAKKTVGMIET
jgi:hypothetical protein